LNRNPSYVFFREGGESAVTFLGVSASDGRTIATDPAFFSKGALAFLIFDRPVFDDDQALVPARTERVSRFVLDQDIGGAITGPGRADLFWGRGKTAGRMAGAVKSTGRLYYLGPRVR
jgi:membrane-bound lytic murein transglycosylase A